jgi:xylulokinase
MLLGLELESDTPMDETILCLDVGTTVVKTVLYSINGQELAVAARPIPLHTPRPGWAEIDPEELWQAVLEVLQESASTAAARYIRAVTLATQGGSFLALNAHGSPVCPLITWMDSRAEPMVQEWRRQGLDATIRQISGWTLEAGLPLAMLAWLRREQPETFAASAHFVSVNDFLTYRLAGVYCMNPSMAGEMLLADVTRGSWSDDLCQLVHIHPRQLSPIAPSAAMIGRLLPEVSRQTGLPTDMALINGGQDHSCEALAVGMTDPGQILLACGTAWVVNSAVVQPQVAMLPSEMNLNCHAMPGRWIASQFLGSLGGTLEWWLTHMWQNPDTRNTLSRSELYSYLDHALTETCPAGGGLYFFPLGGTRQTSTGPGSSGFWGLRLDHSRADLSRAILEGSACELRWSLERLHSAGLPTERLWMIGGAARSSIWPSIIASLTGTTVSLPRFSHGPAMGAAILAVVGLGIDLDLDLARERFNLQTREVLPEPSWQAIYSGYYTRYRELTSKIVTF